MPYVQNPFGQSKDEIALMDELKRNPIQNQVVAAPPLESPEMPLESVEGQMQPMTRFGMLEAQMEPPRASQEGINPNMPVDPNIRRKSLEALRQRYSKNVLPS